jgi:hypothetical protein
MAHLFVSKQMKFFILLFKNDGYNLMGAALALNKNVLNSISKLVRGTGYSAMVERIR